MLIQIYSEYFYLLFKIVCFQTHFKYTPNEISHIRPKKGKNA